MKPIYITLEIADAPTTDAPKILELRARINAQGQVVDFDFEPMPGVAPLEVWKAAKALVDRTFIREGGGA
jgi:hypothetical protein